MTDEYSVSASLPDDDPGLVAVNRILSRWAELAEAEQVEEKGRTTYRLGYRQAWPSDYVLSFLVRLLPLPAILRSLDDTALRGFTGSPRDLGGFYHRCYDLIRQSEVRADREELERLREAARLPASTSDDDSDDPDTDPRDQLGTGGSRDAADS